MGQRLNVTMYHNDNRLANAYYHWSAYTAPSLDILQRIIRLINIGYASCETDPRLYALRLLEATGAGLTAEEYMGMVQEYPGLIAVKEIDRNHGLIAASEAGMNDTERWEEGRINIYLDRKTFDFDVFSWLNFEDYEDYNWIDPRNYPVLSNKYFRYRDVPFTDFYTFKDIFNKIYMGQVFTYNKHVIGII